ncbi:MAG: hypothetical protein JXR64_01540 [Spirochaetales bacterium]|nr:hypothetical protein [Spirochaetales bacterium]
MDRSKFIIWDWNSSILNYNIVKFFNNRGYRQAIFSSLSNEKLVKYFDHIIEEPNKTRLFLENYRIDPKKCIIIGDKLRTYEMAKELGSKSILVNSKKKNFNKLRILGDATILNNLELLDLLPAMCTL